MVRICGFHPQDPGSNPGMETFFFRVLVESRGEKKMAVPGVEPGSSGSQPLMLTTTPYDLSIDNKPSLCESTRLLIWGLRVQVPPEVIFFFLEGGPEREKKKKSSHAGI